MATVTVKPNADGTGATNWTISGGPTTRFGAINNGTASPDDTDFIRNNFNEGGSAEVAYFGFENMPADFDAITAVTMKVRQKGYSNDDDHVRYQLFQSNGTTALSDQIELDINGSEVSSSFRTDTVNFTRTGATDKATWHGVQLKVTHVGPGDGDDPDMSISEIQLEITYDTASAPEIVMTGLNSENIADGDSSPTTTDGTDFGTINVGDTAVTRVFTVTNSGDADLTLGTPSVPTGFTLTEGLDSSISASANDTFSVRLDNSVAGIKHGDISISNNDADENPFNFAVSGVVEANFAEISVTGLSDNVITDGDSTPTTTDGTDFGSVTQNDSTVTRTFKVSNSGAIALTTETPSVPTGFTLTEGLATSIATSGNDTFSVRLDNSVVGVKHGTISFVNNDTTLNPFNFTVSGVVTAAAETPTSSPSITSIIVSGVSQLNTGNALVGVGGARGLGASGTLITEISGKNVLDRTDHEPGASVTVLDNQYSDRFDDLEYYHGSGTLGGAS